MKYLLLTPHKLQVNSNAGWNFITAGIKHIINQSDIRASFEEFDAFSTREWPEPMKFEFDYVVICGNPRYDLNPDNDWLYQGMFQQLFEYQKIAGFKVIDAFQGAGAPLGYDYYETVNKLFNNPRNQEIITLLKSMSAKVITRDSIAQEVNEKSGLKSIQLPCSSYWGSKYYTGIRRVENKKRKIVIVKNMDGYDGAEGILRTISRTHELIATNSIDAEYCARNNLKCSIVFAPVDLCELYQECEEIISYRLHCIIPAAYFARETGAKLFYCSIDSTGETCDAFGISHADYRYGIAEPKEPKFDIQIPAKEFQNL